ncbi:haloacid dehalogenase-like hydrolase, partial [Deinococcus pimensis]|uniref:haloacid dehalogenase-like hydrolase n=1 Tax=Deinococcus pimensis TaxID=309888 RepID=UPI00146FA6C2
MNRVQEGGRLLTHPAPRTVASDLEGTLTTGETWKGLLRFLRERGHGRAVSAFLALKLPGVALAGAGVLDREKVRQAWTADLPRLLRGTPEADVDALAEWVVERELWPGRRDDVLAELEAHRLAGHRVVLASGAYQPVLEAFARRIGAEAVG